MSIEALSDKCFFSFDKGCRAYEYYGCHRDGNGYVFRVWAPNAADVKSKREKERYKHLNAESQRIARRDKKAFLSDQCKEIEENNRMGKMRAIFKKIGDTKGPFYAKMGTIRDRNVMGLTEIEGIKKRWQEYTEELYKKDFHDPDNHNGVIWSQTSWNVKSSGP